MKNMIFIAQYAAKESIISSTTQVSHRIKLRGQEATSLQFDKKPVHCVQSQLLRLRCVSPPRWRRLWKGPKKCNDDNNIFHPKILNNYHSCLQ